MRKSFPHLDKINGFTKEYLNRFSEGSNKSEQKNTSIKYGIRKLDNEAQALTVE